MPSDRQPGKVAQGADRDLAGAIENTSKRIVNCAGCTKCCEKGIAYVLPEERSKLESLEVPLIEIDSITFIRRKGDGSCAMLDKVNKRCSIYKDRPFCCRAFPLDVFSRRGRLEWGVYTYCPTDRLVPITKNGDQSELDTEVVRYLASDLEKHLKGPDLKFLEQEDRVVAQIEILDEHKDDYIMVGEVLKKASQA